MCNNILHTTLLPHCIMSVYLYIYITCPCLSILYTCPVCGMKLKLFLYFTCKPLCLWRFPPAHFGKLYGTLLALSAVVSLLQYPCFEIINGPLNGDPFAVSHTFPFHSHTSSYSHTWLEQTKWTHLIINRKEKDTVFMFVLKWSEEFILMCCPLPQVNVALTILSCLAFIHPIYVYNHCRHQAAQRAKAENITTS